jgi:hypothetical protein
MRLLHISVLTSVALAATVSSCNFRSDSEALRSVQRHDLDGTFQITITQAQPGTTIVDVAFRNTGSTPIKTYAGLLPPYAVVFLAAPSSRPSEPLRRTYIIDDPRPTLVSVDAGETIRTKLDLSQRFADIETMMRKEDVLVFWTYAFPDARRRQSERVFGGFVLRSHRQA